MEDLEICKRISEIEGVKTFHGMGPHGETMYTIDEMQYSSLYNPLIDKALCFDLMVKHKVAIDCSANPYHADVVRERDVYNVSDKNPQRAICLAIIKKFENEV